MRIALQSPRHFERSNVLNAPTSVEQKNRCLLKNFSLKPLYFVYLIIKKYIDEVC